MAKNTKNDTAEPTTDTAEPTTDAPKSDKGGELISKITIAGCNAQPKAKSVKEGEKFPILMVVGMAHRAEVGQTTFGEFIRFRGNFVGVNLKTGERFKSGALILPSLIQDILHTAVSESEGPVEFGIEIGVKYSEKGNTGYEYTVRPLQEPTEADSLSLLEDRLTGKLSVAVPLLAPPAAK